MKYLEDAGATSRSWLIFIGDSSKTDSSGLAGLAYSSAGLTAYYDRPGAAAAAITLATLANASAAWSSGGFVEIDAANMPGFYRFDVPNAVLAAGVKQAAVQLKGAANMRPCNVEVQIGPVPANLLQILGTALTETVGGYLAAGFKKLYDVAAPVLTLASVNQTGDSYARIGAGGAGLTAVFDIATSALTVAGSLGKMFADKIAAITGVVASQADVAALQNNTSTRLSVPDVIERPDSGTTTFVVDLYAYDETNAMEDLDGAPTVALLNQSGTDRSARLDSTTMTRIGQGHYRSIYTASTGDAVEQLRWEFTCVEGGVTRLVGTTSQVQDTTAVDFTSADRAELDALYNRLTATRAGYLDALPNLDAAVSTRSVYAGGDTAGVTTLLSRISGALTISAGKVDVNDKTGFSPANGSIIAATFGADALSAAALSAAAAAKIAVALLDLTDGVETGITLRQAQRLELSAMAGKTDGFPNNTKHFRDINDTKNRLTVTTDANSNRITILVDAA